MVTPFVGVWIEILTAGGGWTTTLVTPFVGVWIEILLQDSTIHHDRSLPSWECGLKSYCDVRCYVLVQSLPSWECGLKLAVR